MAYGDGTIYQYRSGYAAQYYVEGKRRHVYARTKAEVRQRLREALAAKAQGRDLHGGGQTLDSYLQWWLTTVKCPPSVSSVTTTQYSYALGLLPDDLMARKLNRIRPHHIDEAIAAMQRRNLSPRTVAGTRRVLKSALKDAVRRDMLLRNPLDATDPPALRRQEKHLPSWERITAFVASTKGDRWHPLWVLLCYTGMRVGEALALEWGDLDGDLLHITRSIHYDGQNRWVGVTKTPSSVRDVEMVPQVKEALEARRTAQKREKVQASRWEESATIFTKLDGGGLLRATVNEALDSACTRAGFPHITPHDFRHAFISRGAEIGVAPNVMQRIAGHSSVTITLGYYTHLRASHERDAMKKIGGIS